MSRVFRDLDMRDVRFSDYCQLRDSLTVRFPSSARVLKRELVRRAFTLARGSAAIPRCLISIQFSSARLCGGS
jgi:hypothetical protein